MALSDLDLSENQTSPLGIGNYGDSVQDFVGMLVLYGLLNAYFGGM